MAQLEPGCTVRALFDYTAQTQAEISFSVGDEFFYCETNPRGWAKGQIKGKRGWFPVTFVEAVEQKKLPIPPINKRDSKRASATIHENLKIIGVAQRFQGGITENYERNSIIEDKQKISSLLDAWLPNRLSIYEQSDSHPTGPSREVSKKQILFNKIIGPKNKRPVFNVSLSELQKYGRDIPLIVIQCVFFLNGMFKKEKRKTICCVFFKIKTLDRLNTEGLFRVPGNRDKANKLIAEFKDANGELLLLLCAKKKRIKFINYKIESVDFNKLSVGAHTVASVLKSFFQQLPEAVIPPVFTQSFIKAYGVLILKFFILTNINYCYRGK